MFGSPSYRLRPDVKVHTHTHTRGGRGGGVEKGELLHIAIPEHSRKAWNIIEMNYSYIDYKLAKKKMFRNHANQNYGDLDLDHTSNS